LKQDAGGRYYLKFDGVDDFLVTGSINFTATDKMTVWAGVTKLSDAATSIVAELSVNSGGNSGTFALFAPSSAGVAEYKARVRGTIDSFPSAVGAPAPDTSIVTFSGDIAGDSAVFRRNGTTTQTFSTDLGTGTFGNYPLYVGRRGGASLFFSGNLYGLVIRGAASTAAQIAATERYMANKTGVTLP
jgi:hypothetical protein